MLLVIATAARAQEFRADVLAQPVEHRVGYQGSVYQQTGTWLGLRAEATLQHFRFEISTLAGSLGGSADSANPDRDVRTTLVSARWRPLPWLEVGPSAEARRFASGPTVTTWHLYGLSARAETDLGLPALRGSAELTLFPVASGTNAVAPSAATRASIGLELSPERSPFVFRLGYRFERFSMEGPTSTAPRREQFDGLLFGAGVKLRR